MPDSAQLRRILVGARLTLGIVSFVLPRTMMNLFGLASARNPSGPYIARIFGAREMLMAYQLYQASDEELEEVLRQGIMVDGADTLGAMLSMLRGEISFRTFLMLGTVSGAAIATGIMSREHSQANIGSPIRRQC